VVNGRSSFFFKAEKHSIICIHITFYLSTHLLMDIQVVCICWLLWIILQWTGDYR
jgi:hypothetical protein